MKVIQDYGFKHKALSNNFGSFDIEIRGTGLENNAFAYMKVDGREIDRTTRRGFTLIRFTREMQVIDIHRYDVYGDNMAIVEFTEMIYEIGENMYFAVYSYDAHQDVDIIGEMGGEYYKNIKRNLGSEFRTYRTPYSCFGTGRKNKNNTPTILYESLGDWRPNASEPHAILKFTIGLPEYACLNQISNNYIGYDHANSTTSPLSDTTFTSNSKVIELTLRGRVTPSGYVEANISINGSTTKTVVLNNTLFDTVCDKINCSIGDSISVTFSTSGDYEVTFIGMFEKTYLDLDNKSQTVSKSVIGGRRNLISLTGHEYSCTEDLDKLVGVEPFINASHTIGNSSLDCYELNGSIESGLIEIDTNKSYVIFAYIIGNNSSIEINVSTLDGIGAINGIYENGNLLQSSNILSAVVASVPSVLSVPLYQEGSSSNEKHHSGYYEEEGYEVHRYADKPYLRFRENTDTIRITMSGSGIIKLKVVEQVYAFKSNGIILGNFNPD